MLEITDNDTEMVAYLRRDVGYSATGDIREQCLFIPYGTGANGKTTFLNAIKNVLGDDYSQEASPDLLLVKRGGSGIPNDVARLRGARFVTTVETDESRSLNESFVKSLTGGDRISARFMRAEWFDFVPECKVWMATNHKPQIRGTDFGIWRRIRLIPFTVTIPPDKWDRHLEEKLEAEASGILNWIIAGCLEWQRNEEGLQPPEKATAATADYQG